MYDHLPGGSAASRSQSGLLHSLPPSTRNPSANPMSSTSNTRIKRNLSPFPRPPHLSTSSPSIAHTTSLPLFLLQSLFHAAAGVLVGTRTTPPLPKALRFPKGRRAQTPDHPQPGPPQAIRPWLLEGPPLALTVSRLVPAPLRAVRSHPQVFPLLCTAGTFSTFRPQARCDPLRKDTPVTICIRHLAYSHGADYST